MEDLSRILDSLSPELYDDMRDAMRRNYELTTKAYLNMSPLHSMWAVSFLVIAVENKMKVEIR